MKAKSLPSSDSSDVAFAEIPVSSEINRQEAVSGFHADAVIRINTATVAVSNDASAELLSRIVQAVSHAC